MEARLCRSTRARGAARPELFWDSTAALLRELGGIPGTEIKVAAQAQN